MFQKLLKEECYILRQEHLTMPVQKYGKISLMIIKAIYGH